jgi:hypothetical protein
MENVHTAKHFIGDKVVIRKASCSAIIYDTNTYFTLQVKHAFTTKHARDLAPDEGGIVRVGLSTAGRNPWYFPVWSP